MRGDRPAGEEERVLLRRRDGRQARPVDLPRPQSATENCTIHNYNAVPLRNGKRVLVLGNYQAGTWVVDFTDPANARTVAWSDPPPLDPPDLGRGLVVVLVQQLHLRVRDHEGSERLQAQRQHDRRSDEARAPQPADPGILNRLTGVRGKSPLAEGGRPPGGLPLAGDASSDRPLYLCALTSV